MFLLSVHTHPLSCPTRYSSSPVAQLVDAVPVLCGGTCGAPECPAVLQTGHGGVPQEEGGAERGAELW